MYAIHGMVKEIGLKEVSKLIRLSTRLSYLEYFPGRAVS